jgi:nucleoid DNA-binding protein
MLNCAICNAKGLDLTRHIKEIHLISIEQYKTQYHISVVDPSVDLKRKETCIELYGDPNYKNKEAKKLSNEIYEGGHSLRDLAVRSKGCETKRTLYGDPNFTNREQAKETCLKKYGVDNIANIPGVKEKKFNTLMQRYGKIFNWERKDVVSKEELIKLHHIEGLTFGEIGKKLGYTAEGVSYWMKKHGVEVHKKVISSKFKEHTDNKTDVKEYLEYCLKNGRVLSFSEFGKLTADKKNQKLKRLFNAGKSYQHLKSVINEIALHPELWAEFLVKIK